MLIYRIHNKLDGKSYIGQTIFERFQDRYTANKWWKYTDNPYLKNAANKHGIDNFEVTILERNIWDIDKLNTLEEWYATKFNVYHPNGYNLNTCGGNCRKSDETKKKLASATRNQHIISPLKKYSKYRGVSYDNKTKNCLCCVKYSNEFKRSKVCSSEYEAAILWDKVMWYLTKGDVLVNFPENIDLYNSLNLKEIFDNFRKRNPHQIKPTNTILPHLQFEISSKTSTQKNQSIILSKNQLIKYGSKFSINSICSITGAARITVNQWYKKHKINPPPVRKDDNFLIKEFKLLKKFYSLILKKPFIGKLGKKESYMKIIRNDGVQYDSVSDAALAMDVKDQKIYAHLQSYKRVKNINGYTFKKLTENVKNTHQILRSDGEIFPTILAAAKALNVHQSNISKSIAGLNKKIKGFTFKRVPIETIQ